MTKVRALNFTAAVNFTAGIKARSYPERESAANAAYGSFMVAITQHAALCTAFSHGIMTKHIAGNGV